MALHVLVSSFVGSQVFMSTLIFLLNCPLMNMVLLMIVFHLLMITISALIYLLMITNFVLMIEITILIIRRTAWVIVTKSSVLIKLIKCQVIMIKNVA